MRLEITARIVSARLDLRRQDTPLCDHHLHAGGVSGADVHALFCGAGICVPTRIMPPAPMQVNSGGRSAVCLAGRQVRAGRAAGPEPIVNRQIRPIRPIRPDSDIAHQPVDGYDGTLIQFTRRQTGP